METIQAVGTAWRGWLDRTLGAMLLDGRVYARAAQDPSTLTQAVVLLLLAGVAQAFSDTAGGTSGLVGVVGVASGVAAVGGDGARPGGWPRHVPAAASRAGPGPRARRPAGAGVGGVANVALWLWSLAAGVVAVRAALRCTLRRAVLIAVLTWVALIVAAMWMGRLAGREAAFRAAVQQEYLQ